VTTKGRPLSSRFTFVKFLQGTLSVNLFLHRPHRVLFALLNKIRFIFESEIGRTRGTCTSNPHFMLVTSLCTEPFHATIPFQISLQSRLSSQSKNHWKASRSISRHCINWVTVTTVPQNLNRPPLYKRSKVPYKWLFYPIKRQ
jgi:hypothetical protein